MSENKDLSDSEKQWVINVHQTHQRDVAVWADRVFLSLAGLSLATISSTEIPAIWNLIILAILYFSCMCLLGSKVNRWKKSVSGGYEKLKRLKLKYKGNREALDFINAYRTTANGNFLTLMSLLFITYTAVELVLQVKN